MVRGQGIGVLAPAAAVARRAGWRVRAAALLGLGRPPLPGRVQLLMAAAEQQSEVLVCAVQIAAVLAFAALYTVSPKAFPPTVTFEPVPVALGAYGLFTLIRLWLALRGRFGRAFLALSVIVDVAVLMLTIWSFHLQYQAPLGLSLKAPTLMYVFILIALRALRFEARYVLLTGLTAALGWLAMIADAVLHAEPGAMMLTHSFADYATSNHVLLGAEFDKIVSILMVTAVLAVVVARARRLLATATTERVAGAELARFFAPDVAAAIRDADTALAPGQGLTRDAAVLTVDLRGFTPLASRLGADATMTLLGEYQARLVPVIQEHGGSIDKYLGDGILASFGATRASATAAADALGALEALLAAAERWSAERARAGLEPVRVGAAVAHGQVLFGCVGDASRLEYTVIGEPVNLAAKLEKHTKAEAAAALATAAVLDAAIVQGFRPVLPWSTRRNRRCAGVDEPLDLVAYG